MRATWSKHKAVAAHIIDLSTQNANRQANAMLTAKRNKVALISATFAPFFI